MSMEFMNESLEDCSPFRLTMNDISFRYTEARLVAHPAI